ncbi:DUF1064 domain-containing protein [Paraflavitalea speifideaquila]|uniref:DUF1064 domain-containing protein n=1 Tax=Paraflavitalea speifideaquila TaxID=3076558 RepID=UPI0028E3E9E9|nr:DUF1064 domain-containing protein [Paraflavitalea speifideiaquila]
MRFTIQHIANSKVAHLNQHLLGGQHKKEKRSKYNNRKTMVDGIEFDSVKEAKRYGELKLMQKAGHIGFLELQVSFELKVNDEKICTYIADFVYLDAKTGERIVEDVKSEVTRKIPLYRRKKSLMKAIYGITIKEV